MCPSLAICTALCRSTLVQTPDVELGSVHPGALAP
ncbi:hypothetical protein PAM7066_01518 [Palleronia marisminoris]|uniref:Uncharacterized protein n=1 Tax=Palleronia marisminoris TaxID=315423 RepID=A0A1Y5SA19_9RHOB|nr:hypothetical protein PAM7066_01518 [Palleronia marisminoris]